jgi:ABC-type lipoprotein export system ATPase subunit
MKISKIEIIDYNQFKNFTVDLTYPKGHAKEGLPLDKVCFIGQSGTGKTTLLNLIRAIVSHGLIEKSYMNENMRDILVESYFDNLKQLSKIDKGNIQNTLFSDMKMDWQQRFQYLLSYYSESNVSIIFPAEINTDFNSILSDEKEKKEIIPLKNQQKEVFLSNKIEIDVEKEFKNKIFDFEINNVKTIWDLILEDIQKYKVANLSFRSDITNKVQSGELAPENLILELNKWNEQNPNPLKDLAEKLNLILNKFNLEIRPEPDFKSAEDLKFIKVYQKNGGEIPNNYWSTGTKQLILTATPLIKLNTDKSIVLIDEPERSFYPDIQQEIVNFYTKLAPNAQFFIATHSPIIASSFEPWEIVELKFSENGDLVQDLYFKGERQVENYFIQPQYLRWDSILNKIFDLEHDGNPARKLKLSELSEKGLKLKQLKEQGNANPELMKKLWEEYKGIAELLDWKIEMQ